MARADDKDVDVPTPAERSSMRYTLIMTMPNGEKVTGDLYEWVAGLIAILPPDQKAALCQRVRRGNPTSVTLPGSAIVRPLSSAAFRRNT